MTDDWLDTGHGPDAARLSTVFSRSSADGGGAHAATSRPRLPRSAGPVSVSVLVAAVMLVGSAGAVYAIRESLFPSLGAETSPSVWQNPAPPDAIPASTTTPSIATTTTDTTTTVPSSTVSNPVSSIVSSTSTPADVRATPTSTIDDHDSGGSGTEPDDLGSDNSGRDADDPGSDGSGSDGSGSDGSGSDGSGSDGSGSDGSGSDGSGSGSDDAIGRDDGDDAGPDPDVDPQDG